VLVHDFGANRQQVLPLVAPLHEAGYVVMAINLRGRGPSASVGSTFGLNEAQDVRAAVELLRRRKFVDPASIGVLGIGTGGTAALLAAEQDPQIAALVLDHPVRQFQDVLNSRLGPKQPWLGWVRPFCKWAFEIAYKVDADDMNLNRFATLMQSKPVLMLDEEGQPTATVSSERVKQVTQFLRRHLVARGRPTASLLQREAVGTAPIERSGPSGIPSGGEAWPPQRSAADLLQRAKETGW
jgi:pimeloyl-ACP methyl ester carboxylesterase